MKRFDGVASSPIWLIGDSNPKPWEEKLELPFDSKHPIRHNIWTSVYDVIQRQIYLNSGRRISDSTLYIRNAIANADNKPEGYDLEWKEEVRRELKQFLELIHANQPLYIITFGSFSFEFVRRACGERPCPFITWDTKKLGEQFALRVSGEKAINIIPLLHRSIAGGYFLTGHKNFCPAGYSNYFEYVGEKLGFLFLTHLSDQRFWCLPTTATSI